MVLVVAGLIVVTGLALEGAGAIINWGAKSALAQTASAQVTPTQVKGE